MTPTSMEFVEYLEALAYRTTDREILETFVRGGLKNEEWIKKMGGETIVFAPLQVVYPGSGCGCRFSQGSQGRIYGQIEREGEGG